MSIGVYVFIYFLIGALFCLAIDMVNTYYNNRGDIREEEVDFSNLEKFAKQSESVLKYPGGIDVTEEN